MRFIFLFLLGLAANELFAQSDKIVDARDNQEYRYVRINDLLWFSENLNYNSPKSSCYSDESINCDTWGRLYNKAEALNACPTGWRLPNTRDWEAIDTVNIFQLMDTSFWKNNQRHTNSLGLSLQPSGIKHRRKYWNQYLSTTIWFESSENEDQNWHLHVHGDNGEDSTHIFHQHEEEIKHRKFAIRCVKDLNP